MAFAKFLKIIEIETTFKACDGIHMGKIIDRNNVLIKMNDVNKIDKVDDGFFQIQDHLILLNLLIV